MMKKVLRHHTIETGFTLIEMMIVIGIIALLAALTLGISSSVMRNAEIHKTEDALKLLTMSLQEWELEKGRSITFEGYEPELLPDGSVGMYDIFAEEYLEEPSFTEQGVMDVVMLDAMETRIENLILKLLHSESATDILSHISPDLFIEHVHDADGTTHKVVVDAWGTPIGIVFPGRNYRDVNPTGFPNLDPSFDYCGDQTVRDEAEDGLGSCINARPYFVSAGPDRLWGYRFQSNEQNSGPGIDVPFESGIFYWEYSLDNIYSYEPFLVESAR